MFEKHHRDYKWENGVPLPIGGIEGEGQQERTFRVLADSYSARVSVEQYRQGKFERIIYDSALLDFRRLKPEFQQAWESDRVEESEDLIVCHVRDEADRLVIIERHHFEGDRETKCEWYYPSGGILLAVEHFEEDVVRVVDAAGRAVMSRPLG